MLYRASVSSLSGHTSRTVRANYLMKERKRDIDNANAFMEAVANEPAPDAPPRIMSPGEIPAVMAANRYALPRRQMVQIDLQSVMSVATAQVDDDHAVRVVAPTVITENGIADLPWGTLHPDRLRGPHQRARWTPFEVQFIGRWCEEALNKYPAMTQVISKCRESLATDYPDMIAYFHVNHVISTSRFVHGYRLYKRG